MCCWGVAVAGQWERSERRSDSCALVGGRILPPQCDHRGRRVMRAFGCALPRLAYNVLDSNDLTNTNHPVGFIHVQAVKAVTTYLAYKGCS